MNKSEALDYIRAAASEDHSAADIAQEVYFALTQVYGQRWDLDDARERAFVRSPDPTSFYAYNR